MPAGLDAETGEEEEALPGDDGAPILEPPPEAPAAALAAPGGHAHVRAGPDGYPRLHLPSDLGCIRLSLNADLTQDMRAICFLCGATFSRTCRPADPPPRRGTKTYGQGRPMGNLYSWLLRGCDGLPGGHTREEHRGLPRASFPQREAARAQARLLPGSDVWFNAERPIIEGDAPSGEPLLVP